MIHNELVLCPHQTVGDISQTVIVTRGIPGCGKTFWANEVSKKFKLKRINRDTLRTMVDFGEWSSENEKEIVEARDTLLRQFLLNGHSVLIDDTNIQQFNVNQIFHTINCEFPNVVMGIKYFDTPLETCIQNDANRRNINNQPLYGSGSVGKDVILKMYKKYQSINRNEVPGEHLPAMPWEYDATLPKCIIVDIDGTVANHVGIRHIFSNDVDRDLPVHDVITPILNIIKNTDTKIVIMSGRDEKNTREKTESWLSQHGLGLENDFVAGMFMRKGGDTRKDYIVKYELFNEYIRGKYNPMGAFDDRNQVVRMWRNLLGVRVFQVVDGNY
ncbi:hypothetical protein [Microcystis phage Mel-JY01]